jgi:hypothetical protein
MYKDLGKKIDRLAVCGAASAAEYGHFSALRKR